MSTNTNVLHEYAEGRIQHLNRGQCPDIVSGHDSRDPDCPVCAALTTAAAVPPAGWVMVPVKPTEEMKAAAVKYANGPAVYKNVRAEVLRIEEGIYGEAYEAMLAAAPKAEPVPAGAQPLPLLVRDIAADFSTTPIQVCKALADLGFGGNSLNMAVTPQMAESLRAHFGNRYCAAGMCLEADGAHDACCQRNATQAAPAGFEPGESRINAQAEPVHAGEYPPLPSRYGQAYGEGKNINDWQDTFNADQMRAYVDADRAMRAQAAPAAVAGPSEPSLDLIHAMESAWHDISHDSSITTEAKWLRFYRRVFAAAPTTQAEPSMPEKMPDAALRAALEALTTPLDGTVARILAIYSAFHSALSATPTTQAALQPAVQQGDANWQQLRSALAMAMLGWGGREDRTMETCYAVLDAVSEPGMPLALLRAAPDWRDAVLDTAPAAQRDAPDRPEPPRHLCWNELSDWLERHPLPNWLTPAQKYQYKYVGNIRARVGFEEWSRNEGSPVEMTSEGMYTGRLTAQNDWCVWLAACAANTPHQAPAAQGDAEDTARLDYMIEAGVYLDDWGRNGAPKWRVIEDLGHCEHNYPNGKAEFPTARAAIDAARSQAKEGGAS